MAELVARLAGRMGSADEERFMLQRVQPALIGLIGLLVATSLYQLIWLRGVTG